MFFFQRPYFTPIQNLAKYCSVYRSLHATQTMHKTSISEILMKLGVCPPANRASLWHLQFHCKNKMGTLPACSPKLTMQQIQHKMWKKILRIKN